jgi:hypothetical protein
MHFYVFNNEDFCVHFSSIFCGFFFCVHFVHFLLPPIVEVDISDIAIILGMTNMVKAIISGITLLKKLIVLPNTQILGIGYTPYPGKGMLRDKQIKRKGRGQRGMHMQTDDDDDDVFYSFLQKQKIEAGLHIYLEEGTYYKRLFRGPNTNDMKK